jgi:hypothetical protein
MRTLFLILFSSIFSLIPLTACTGDVRADAIPPASTTGWSRTGKKTMRAFKSERELADYFKKLAAEQRARRSDVGAVAENTDAVAPAEKLAKGADDSVTNVQHAGVDEGGIVKVHGDHLVVLRRGRLFTVAIGDGALKPISAVDAFGPEINPTHTWYDEMLVSDDTVVVIGYSYERGGTEIGLFQIDDQGQLSYRSTFHLRSNDYYSSRNYASRLVDGKLIFYTPLYFYPGAEDPFQSFPAVRQWHKGAQATEFRRIVSATRVYRPEVAINSTYGMALHTVTVCDLANGGFDCNATAVVGPAGRVFYVSPQSVYVWVTDWVYRGNQAKQQSMVYRMPLDGSAPSALQVSGSPVDQFSFLEANDGQLNVLVRSDGAGDGMWAAEVAAGDVALLRVPATSFSDGSSAALSENYQSLPKPEEWTFQNRFIGDYLLYGTGSGWGNPRNSKSGKLLAVRWINGVTNELTLAHGVDRIEAMGSDAVVVGTDGSNLHFTSIRLAESPEVAYRFTRRGASQGELRSHGFFYRPEGPDSGLLGLPISLPGRPGYQHLFENSAAILFLRVDSLQFEKIGELAARSETAVNDACRASCVDWYGNARPLFVRGRVLALLGYEIVEGKFDEGSLRELRRVNYAPGNVAVRRDRE